MCPSSWTGAHSPHSGVRAALGIRACVSILQIVLAMFNPVALYLQHITSRIKVNLPPVQGPPLCGWLARGLPEWRQQRPSNSRRPSRGLGLLPGERTLGARSLCQEAALTWLQPSWALLRKASCDCWERLARGCCSDLGHLMPVPREWCWEQCLGPCLGLGWSNWNCISCSGANVSMLSKMAQVAHEAASGHAL